MKINREDSNTVFGFIEKRAKQQGTSIAIRFKGREDLSYADLLTMINLFKQQLNTLGLGRNDRIAIVSPNGPEMALAILSIMCTASCAPLNPKYTASELEYYLNDLNIKAVLVYQGAGKAIYDVADKLNIQLIEMKVTNSDVIGEISLNASKPATETLNLGPIQADDIALILHTSGTTSRPKIVPLTQNNICVSTWNIIDTLNIGNEDSCFNIMPLFHIHGIMAGLLTPILSGGNVICSPGFAEDPFFISQFFPWLLELKPTWYTAVPTMHQAILSSANKYPDITKQCQLKFIRSSSASLAPQVMFDLESKFNAPVIEAYGMTEASHQMACNPLPPAEHKPKSVGLAAGPEVAIMNELGQKLTNDDVGEIVIRGENVMQAYENNDEANKEAFFGDWFRTGDQGFMDEDNYLFLTGRLKELINRGGENISPREIDEVLLEHPAVAQAVAFSAPHPTLGEVPAAAVILHKDQIIDQKALQDFAAKKLAAFKIPNPIVFVDEIPKGPTGKLQRIGLADKILKTTEA